MLFTSNEVEGINSRVRAPSREYFPQGYPRLVCKVPRIKITSSYHVESKLLISYLSRYSCYLWLKTIWVQDEPGNPTIMVFDLVSKMI